MAYSELIKDFTRIRDYMREFYVYGFKSREEYDAKSARSHDNERHRFESWLGEYMAFHQNTAGKAVLLSVDSRRMLLNPLYKAFKAKSFTNKDITTSWQAETHCPAGRSWSASAAHFLWTSPPSAKS